MWKMPGESRPKLFGGSLVEYVEVILLYEEFLFSNIINMLFENDLV